jgi:hypothetical protein
LKRSGFPALIYNKENEATIITCMRSATPPSLSYEEFKKTQESYYIIGSFTINRGFKKTPPAKDHNRHVTFISLKTACSTFLQFLKVFAFLWLHMLQGVKTTKLGSINS